MSSSVLYTASLPSSAPLPSNPSSRHPMDEHEFRDLHSSLSRGLMKEADQITKLKAATSAHTFTSEQVIKLLENVKGQPVQAVCTLYPAISDADENFEKVLAALKWIEERQEIVTNLKLDQSKYAKLLKK